jgi:hypothetical protein
MASDGKWYPPEQAPRPEVPQTQPVSPYSPAGPATTPPPAQTSSAAKGCLIAAAVVFGLLGLGVVGVGVFLAAFGDDVVESAVGGGPCPFLSDDEASDALGSGTEAIETRGLSNVLTVIDARVLATEPSCALLGGESEDGAGDGGLGRVARYEGGEADERYAQELEKAKGITEDRGNGVSVTSDEYLNRELEDFGDEAFCTTSSGVGAGVLVRDGDTLVYVSVVADVSQTPGVNLDPENPRLGTDDAHCELAQQIARDVLD